MMVSHSHKLAFFHIPKTGGTSIEAMLFPYCETQLVDGKRVTIDKPTWAKYAHIDAQHSTPAWSVKEAAADITGYFTFCFVRNPWDRMLSMYFSSLAELPMRLNASAPQINTGVRQLLKQMYGRPKEGFVQSRYFQPEGWENFYSRVCRFEEFDYECGWIAHHVGLDSFEPQRHNISNMQGIRYQEVFTDETARLVEDYFAEDIALLGYTYE